jgi:hypothetical protein
MSGPAQQDTPTLEERVARLEAIVLRALAAAELHPLGKRIVRLLGLAE